MLIIENTYIQSLYEANYHQTDSMKSVKINQIYKGYLIR